MTQGTQNTIIPTNLPSFPWVVGDKLDAVPLNNAFIMLFNLINNMANQITALEEAVSTNNLGVSITSQWGGGNVVTAGPYVLSGSVPNQFTIVSMEVFIGTAGGSFHATVVNNGTAVVGLADLVVVQPNVVKVIAIDNTVVLVGSELELIISNVVGTPTNAWITIIGQTTPQKQQILGVTVGSAFGDSVAPGVMTSTTAAGTDREGFGSAVGNAMAIGHIMATMSGHGAATGTAIATAAGLGVMIGGAVGLASGHSVANAISQQYPTLILDDTTQAGLDFNPLG